MEAMLFFTTLQQNREQHTMWTFYNAKQKATLYILLSHLYL